ncbi:hypothetical protein Q4566_00605 [Tamlana sp. 2_MG-2023]|uniref:hypothetical protein n=1 Tax=unclassified Tamlana TaxID=2614803 RepID=UPI0026E372D2|nr:MULTISPECIES: hypothetical protein [unclassified Tamlana]MDO6758683.1 hypothetical protein [Tamlana sp. 2_MG-2023]MDO6789382.1 hypothetical protein [Tamlana sp. 1_MG-2023]
MNKSFIAYDIIALEKKKILSTSQSLYKSKLISEKQWDGIREAFNTNLYSPSVFMRVLLFILSYIGFSTAAVPFGFIFMDLDNIGFQILFTIVGILLLFLTEKVLIQNKHHYLSGVTEAGLFSGFSFIALGILFNEPENILVYPIVLFILSALASIRYLNRVTLLLSIAFLGWIIFQTLVDIGGYAKAVIPFAFMLYFGLLFLGTLKLEKTFTNIIFNDFYSILKAVSLTCFYVAGNYFVVRELSIDLMGINLTEDEDIPFAYLFYAFTLLIPLGYIYWGIKKKRILFLRVGLMTTALSVMTFIYYFSTITPVVVVTISGALLIISALILLNYLKKPRHGFTRENMILNETHSKDLTAFIASQTLGGNSTPTEDESYFGGGGFGGGGANSNW